MWELGVGVVAAVALSAGPAPPLPDLRDPGGQPCNLPVSDSLTACPEPDRPPASCVLPVDLPRTVVVPQACPRPDPSPEGRVIPVRPATP